MIFIYSNILCEFNQSIFEQIFIKINLMRNKLENNPIV